MSGAHGRRGKREKKSEEKETVSDQNLLPTNIPVSQPVQDGVIEALNRFFPGYPIPDEFIKFLSLMRDSGTAQETETPQLQSEKIIYYPPFSLIPLFYCQEIMHSMLFKEMS